MKRISLTEALKGIDKVQHKSYVIHPLHEILIIVLVASVCGATSYVKIGMIAKSKEMWLRKFLELENGIPDACTIRDIVGRIDTEKSQEVFAQWIKYIARKVFSVTATDGEQTRWRTDNQKRPFHVVSAFFQTCQMALGQLAHEEKSKEITLIPKLLEMFEITGCIVTVEAAEAQTEIAEKIISKGADYCISLGGDLCRDIKLYAENKLLTESRDELMRQDRYFSLYDSEHVSIKKREYYVCNDIAWLSGADEWERLSGFGVCVSAKEQEGIVTISYNYSVYSVENMTAKQFAICKRSHWAMENRLHWVLDVVFREDESQERKDNSAEILNIFRQMAVNILRMDLSVKGSISDKQFRCLLDERYLEKIILFWVSM